MASIKETLINAVAATAAIGAGTTIIGNKIELARHDERIGRIERLDNKLDSLTERLDRFNVDLTRVQTKQDTDRVPRQ